jgi:hypothetical protein
VLNASDLDDLLLLSNVRIDAEGKLDDASLRLVAQLTISHEKLDTIEDEIEVTSRDPLFLRCFFTLVVARLHSKIQLGRLSVS